MLAGAVVGIGCTVVDASAALRWLGALGPGPVASAAPLADPVTDLLGSYLSTLVPGPGDDPSGGPGAVEAGAIDQLVAQAPYVIPFLVADLTTATLAAHGQPFPALGYPEREALVVEAFADPTRSVYHLIALAIGAGTFYGDFRNRAGGDWLGFPGPADGYLDTWTERTGHGQPEAEAVPA